MFGLTAAAAVPLGRTERTMTRCATLVAAGLGAVSLAGCLTTTTATNATWEHFDACPDNTAFHQYVTCAKQNRQAACEASRNCSATNAIVAYADNLDQSVQRREMTEPEARRKWLEYRMDREAAQSGSARTAADRATAIVSSPVCTGKTMSC
jgi:hypothetical protein